MLELHFALVKWYQTNARIVPWRNTQDPYKIWLSEIILQQTRVQQGLAYYQKFIEQYPTIFDLAKATEQEILTLWQGLGYYSRARNLHATARTIVQTYDGIFPSKYEEILQLKGIGSYTAAAIASFAFNEPKAVVDGNVYRFLARYFNKDTAINSAQGKNEFQQLADSLIHPDQPALHNQAIMEFGALQCSPNKPNCTICVLKQTCRALINGTVNQRPTKIHKKKITIRYFYYCIFIQNKTICLQKRVKNDIWKHLYEFPCIENSEPYDEQTLKQLLVDRYDLQYDFISQEYVHLLSHQRIIARFIHFSQIPQKIPAQTIPLNKMATIPLPQLINKYYRLLDVLT